MKTLRFIFMVGIVKVVIKCHSRSSVSAMIGLFLRKYRILRKRDSDSLGGPGKAAKRRQCLSWDPKDEKTRKEGNSRL